MTRWDADGAAGEAAMRFIDVVGPFAALFARAEVGVHLVHIATGALLPIQVGTVAVTELGAETDVPLAGEDAIARLLERPRHGLDDAEENTPDPLAWGPVIRIHDRVARTTIDLRSRLTHRSPLDHAVRSARSPPLVSDHPLPDSPRPRYLPMPTQKFTIVVWQDGSGCYTARSLLHEEASATDATAAGALQQVKQYLRWRGSREPLHADELLEPELISFRIDVRGGYQSDEESFPDEQPTSVRVACVAGRRKDDSFVCCLPLLNLRFHCHTREAVQPLAAELAGKLLSGLDPRQISRFLVPGRMYLDSLNIKCKDRGDRSSKMRLPELEAVAEPLGDRATRQRLSHAWCRDRVVADLVERLRRDRVSILLVGEGGVGKTTILANAVRQIEQEARRSRRPGGASQPPRVRHAYWLTSGQRIVAGMQYLGQWEIRCEEIIDELSAIQGVLCVDQLLGLVQAGGGDTAGASVASFFMPYLERGELRLIAEATPRELDACRRLLPGLESLFQVVRIDEFEPHEAREVLDKIAQSSKRNLHVDPAPGVMDVAYRLFRRFLPYQPFPGQCAEFVRQLFDRETLARQTTIQQQQVIDRFSTLTGVSQRFLRDDVSLAADDVREFFRDRVYGQDDACRAATRLVMAFKAGLTDPRRPLGTFLFCGPTGVGKTEMSRAIAAYLFGSGDAAKRLLRLDMSEYAGYGAAQRLTVSSDGEPSEFIKRLRAQPFSVVLLDEIEKADAEVFDVLLGALDEGRLTDQYGRTTTFRSAVVIMTSNLGSDTARPMGFDPLATQAFEREVISYFRPEFVNRIDQLVTFRPLDQETILQITRKELQDLALREGLSRGPWQLSWDAAVEQVLAAKGFDARFGARPLQRVVEREVVAPLANWLAENPTLRGTTLRLHVQRGQIAIAIGPPADVGISRRSRDSV